MNASLIILIFSAICVPVFAIRFVSQDNKPDHAPVFKVFKMLFASLMLSAGVVALPLCIINHFVLAEIFYYVDPDYRAAKELEAKTDPGLNVEWPLEPPIPVFWPFPVISRNESSDHIYAKQQVKTCFEAAVSKHPGYLTLSFFALLVVYSPVLISIYNAEL